MTASSKQNTDELFIISKHLLGEKIVGKRLIDVIGMTTIEFQVFDHSKTKWAGVAKFVMFEQL